MLVRGRLALGAGGPSVTALVLDPASTIILGEVGSQLAGYGVLKVEQPPSCVTGPKHIELVRLNLGEEFLGRGFGEKLLLEVHAQAKRLGATTAMRTSSKRAAVA